MAVAPAVGALWVGSADRDGLGEALVADGDAEGDGLALTGGTGGADGRSEGAAPVRDAAADAGPVDPSGTLARTSSGSALSRDGFSYENIPLASPAAATTATTAPPTPSSTVRRLPRGFTASSYRPPSAGVCSNRRRSAALGASGLTARNGIVASASAAAAEAGAGGVGAGGVAGCSAAP
ncbi:hypothetical protein [Streptomyces sp. NBC_00461]|uniref:hypothetical protein n=1 Tax=Streptomyces sp. NBC_00461 TaxID=2975750 RepID=UPI002E183D91